MSVDISKFHVLTMISNQVRYESRYRLFFEFERHMKRSGLDLWTAEIAFGDRDFEVTDKDNDRQIQLRTLEEIWHKERALNLLVNRLTEKHPDWEYIAWVDADVTFNAWEGPKAWYIEAVQMLQHFEVIQLFQTAVDLGPSGEALATHTGFVYNYAKGIPLRPGYASGHPGYAWAMTRKAYDATPFIDWAVLGSGDYHMACGWVGAMQRSVYKGCSPGYDNRCMVWEEQAERNIRRDLGYLPGTIFHAWHGPKNARGYDTRSKILIDYQFNPDRDLKVDSYGLYRLADHGDQRSIDMRDKMREYFASRREDSNELV